MSDSAEGGASIAWRLLATLEGGSLLLATSALLAYTASKRAERTRQQRRPVKTVLLTNSICELGWALKRRMESQGCTVKTLTSGAISEADSGTDVDALVVVGAESGNGLNGISDLVMDDVHKNIKLLDSLSSRVHRGGSIAWACAGAEADAQAGAFSSAAAAFDTVLHTSLQQVAKVASCEPIWVGRCSGAEKTAERVVAALMTLDTLPNATGYSIRSAVMKVGESLYRWLKTIT